MKKLLLLLAFIVYSSPGFGCDDTLVMLLTAKNPNSEFSQAIRKVATSLTHLGAMLKAEMKTDYDLEMQAVMQAWLDFTTRYMTNPPEEAKTDRNWAEKTRRTSEAIGNIRRLVQDKKFQQAHDLVLELSSHIGEFFEAVGVSPEKKLFIETSANLAILEQKILSGNREPALASVASLAANLQNFHAILPEVASSTAMKLEEKLVKIKSSIADSQNLPEIDPEAVEIKYMFEELRSHVLMMEWFPETVSPEKGTIK